MERSHMIRLLELVKGIHDEADKVFTALNGGYGDTVIGGKCEDIYELIIEMLELPNYNVPLYWGEYYSDVFYDDLQFNKITAEKVIDKFLDKKAFILNNKKQADEEYISNLLYFTEEMPYLLRGKFGILDYLNSIGYNDEMITDAVNKVTDEICINFGSKVIG